jgi:hypothetical protein
MESTEKITTKAKKQTKCLQCQKVIEIGSNILRVNFKYGREPMGSSVFCSPGCFEEYKKE